MPVYWGTCVAVGGGHGWSMSESQAALLGLSRPSASGRRTGQGSSFKHLVLEVVPLGGEGGTAVHALRMEDTLMVFAVNRTSKPLFCAFAASPLLLAAVTKGQEGSRHFGRGCSRGELREPRDRARSQEAAGTGHGQGVQPQSCRGFVSIALLKVLPTDLPGGHVAPYYMCISRVCKQMKISFQISFFVQCAMLECQRFGACQNKRISLQCKEWTLGCSLLTCRWGTHAGGMSGGRNVGSSRGTTKARSPPS